MAPRKPRPTPAARTDAAVAVARADGYINAFTNIGTLFDKRTAGRYLIDRLAQDWSVQEENWRGNPLFARIVELPVGEMMRPGWELQIHDEAPDTGTNETYDAFGAQPPVPAPPPKPPGVIKPPGADTEDMADAVCARYEELHGDDMLQTALQYARAYGGGAILVGADDGQLDLTKPLNMDGIKAFDWLNVLTAREIRAVSYYGDPTKPKYGEPEIYRLQADIMPQSALGGGKPQKLPPPIRDVHESRIIPCDGIVTSRRHRIECFGWGDSVLVRTWEAIRDLQAAYAGAAHLATDVAQGVFKMAGFADAMTGQSDKEMRAKYAELQQTMSSARMMLIDANEDFERKGTPLAGLSDLIIRLEYYTACVADMPVSVLMGESPSGLNATGDPNTRWFYDRIDVARKKKLKPNRERLLRLIMRAKNGPTKGVEPEDWTTEDKPLWQPTDVEKATTEKTRMETYTGYITAQVLMPEEVAASVFGGRDSEIQIDLEGRQKLADEHAASVEEAQKLAPPTTPGAPPPPGNGVPSAAPAGQ